MTHRVIAATRNQFGGLGIRQLGDLLRKKRVSSLELTRECVKALQATGTEYNAVAELVGQGAEEEAAKADARLSLGESGSWLTGIPFGAKDVLATSGTPTRWGSFVYREQRFDYDATVIDRLQHVNGVLVAKLAMVELAGAGGYRWPTASITGPSLNPWHPDHWAGGSSSGSAAAVCAHLVPFALGSETGGSIVIPASFCGVTGFRPSYGVVSRYGAMTVAWSMDKIGPIARSAADCELVFRAIAGVDPCDPTTTRSDFHFTPNRRVRMGILPMDLAKFPDTAYAFDQAIEVFGRSGVELRNVTLPDRNYKQVFDTIFAAECSVAHRDLIASPRLEMVIDDQQRRDLRAYADVRLPEYVEALEQRMAATHEIRSLFQDVDVLIAPTVASEAPRVVDDLVDWRREPHYATLGAIAGIPGLSVPMGFGRRGLPLGLTIMADLYRDATCLSIGKRFQRETDWHLRRPDSEFIQSS